MHLKESSLIAIYAVTLACFYCLTAAGWRRRYLVILAIFVNSDRLYEAQPDQEAMYLLMPTTRNVERIINEFSNGHRQFKRVHLFFVDGTSLLSNITIKFLVSYLLCIFFPLIHESIWYFSSFRRPFHSPYTVTRDTLLNMRYGALS